MFICGQCIPFPNATLPFFRMLGPRRPTPEDILLKTHAQRFCQLSRLRSCWIDWSYIAGSSMFARLLNHIPMWPQFFSKWALQRAWALLSLSSTKPSLPGPVVAFSFRLVFFNTCKLAWRASTHLWMLPPKGQQHVQEPSQHIIFHASEVKDILVEEPMAPLRSVCGDPAILGVCHYLMWASIFLFLYPHPWGKHVLWAQHPYFCGFSLYQFLGCVLYWQTTITDVSASAHTAANGYSQYPPMIAHLVSQQQVSNLNNSHMSHNNHNNRSLSLTLLALPTLLAVIAGTQAIWMAVIQCRLRQRCSRPWLLSVRWVTCTTPPLTPTPPQVQTTMEVGGREMAMPPGISKWETCVFQ